MTPKLKRNAMDIKDFVSQFDTHPILFVGSGLSRRYLKESPKWLELLINISKEIWGNDDKYLELAQKYNLDPTLIANDFEELFRNEIIDNPKFVDIKNQNNDNIRRGKMISPFKIYLSSLFSKLDYNEDNGDEIMLFKSLRNSIKSIVTTNYDGMLEDLFKFDPLVGNNIILSKQYGCIYKMHGCYTDPEKIIFTKSDYDKFHAQNKLIIAQLISLFIHNPVIFLGYGAEDCNVNSVLETIYEYVGNNQALRDKIKKNFLVVQYYQGSKNTKVTDYDKNLPSGVHLSFKQIQTDDYTSIYQALLNASYGVEAGTLRFVDDLANRIFTNTNDKKNAKIINYFVNDLNNTDPSNLVLGIMDKNDVEQVKQSIIYKDKHINVTYDYFIENYFKIIDNNDTETLKLINTLKPKIAKNQYFPIFAFNTILSTVSFYLNDINEMKDIQDNLLNAYMNKCKPSLSIYNNIEGILNERGKSDSFKHKCLCYNVWRGKISLTSVEKYLRNYSMGKATSEFRRLITIYDYLKYSVTEMRESDDFDEFDDFGEDEETT